MRTLMRISTIAVFRLLLSLFSFVGALAFAESRDSLNIAISPVDYVNQWKGYFVLIEEEEKDKWTIKAISERPITKRENDKQEILFFDKTLKNVTPVYEKIFFWRGRDRNTVDMVECSALVDPRNIYTPCNSSLTKVCIGMSVGKNIVSMITTFGLASGTWKELDKEKVSRIIDQTNMIDRLLRFRQDCENTRNLVVDSLGKMTLNIQVIDRTGGLLKSERVDELITYVKNTNVDSLSCPIDLNNVRYSVVLLKQNPSYELVIKGLPRILTHNQLVDSNYTISALIETKSLKLYQVYPKYSHEDENLQIIFDGNKIHFGNKTKQFVEINSVSFYYQNEIANLNLSQPLVLPPLSQTREPIYLHSFLTANMKEKADHTVYSIEEAKSKIISFGFAVRYIVKERALERSLFNQLTCTLWDVMQASRESAFPPLESQRSPHLMSTHEQTLFMPKILLQK